MLGKSFSHYRVLEPLGQGGMGVVYLAEDTLLGRRVAIKFPHADGPSQRLLKEARTASSLNHPAIAAVYDCGMFEDHPYVVMEFVEGENLGVILARGPLPPKRALEIAAQAAAALEALGGLDASLDVGSTARLPSAAMAPARNVSDDTCPSPTARRLRMKRSAPSGIPDWSGCGTMLGLNNAEASKEYSLRK